MEVLSNRERLESLVGFRSWAESRGLRVASTRLSQYIQAFSRYSEIADFRTLPQSELDIFLFCLREVDELLWIYKGVQRGEPNGVLAVVEKTLGGQSFARDDRDSSARNHSLELRAASYFLQAGFSADMSERSDLVISMSDAKLYVECKRLESHNKARWRARHALRQIQSRLAPPGDLPAFGLVVLDIGKLLHPGQGLALGATLQDARDGLRAQLLKLEEEYEFSRVFRPDKRVLSVWLQVVVPVLHLREGLPSTRFSSLHLPLVPEFGIERRVFDRLRSVFEVAQPD